MKPYQYYNSKQTSGRDQASPELLQVRNLNNFVKSALIQHASMHMIQTALSQKITIPFSVLEVSCGAMGDLRKWYSSFPAGFLDHIDGFDISDQCIARAKERVLPTQKVELQVADASKPWPFSSKYWAVSCQMALHYFVYNESTAADFFERCDKVLLPGGLVVLTFPDSDMFAQRYMVQKSNFGNSLYTVDQILGIMNRSWSLNALFSQDPSDQYWGIEYQFTLPGCVERCLEHFIPWRGLAHIASLQGFQLLLHENFETFARSQWGISSMSNPSCILRTMFSLPSSWDQCNRDVQQVSSFYNVMIFQKPV